MYYQGEEKKKEWRGIANVLPDPATFSKSTSIKSY
jgi:hypothetical protein